MAGYARSNLYDLIANYPETYNKQQRGGFFNKTNVLSSTINLINAKKEFLVKVFANLIVQLGITFFVMEYFPANEVTHANKQLQQNEKNKHAPPNKEVYITLFIFVIQVIIILVMAFIPMPMMFKLLLFTIFSLLGGISLSFIRNLIDPAIIKTALLGVAGIFTTMFLLGMFLLVTGIKFGFGTGFILWVLLTVLLISSLVFMFLNKYQFHVKLFSLLGILLFSVYIMYDTNRILQKDYYGDFVTASMDYYLDILNLFLDLIQYNNK